LRLQKKLLVLTCLLVAIGLTLFHFLLSRDREWELSRAHQELKQQASIIEQHVLHKITDIDNLLKYIREEVADGRDIPSLRALLLNLAALNADYVDQIAIINREGDFLTSSQIPFLGLNVLDRTYFSFHQNNAFREMLISHPLLGRLIDKMFIPMSLRLYDDRNGFTGIVLSSTKPEYFQTFFSSVSSDPDLVMVLALESGEVLASSGIKDVSKVQLHNNRVFQEAINGRDLGKECVRFLDDKRRMVVSGKIGFYPLYFLIAKEEGSILSNHYSRAHLGGGFASGLFVGLFLFTWAVFWVLRKEAQKTHALRKEASENLLFFSAIPESAWDWRVREEKIVVNDAFYKLLGYEGVQTISNLQEWLALIHPEDVPLVERAFQRHYELKQPFSLEFRVKARSGDWRWTASKGILVESDDDGNPVRMIGILSDAQPVKELDALVDKQREELIHTESRLAKLIHADEDRELFLEILLQGLRALQEPNSLSGVVSKLLNLCRELVDAKDGYVAFLNPNKETQQIMALQAGINPTHILTFPVFVSELESSVYKGKRVRYENNVEIGWIREPGNPPIFLENIIISPIFSNGEVIGLLALANRIGGFKSLGSTFLDTFSLLISTAMRINRKGEELPSSSERSGEMERLLSSGIEAAPLGPMVLTDLIKEAVGDLREAATGSVSFHCDIHPEVPVVLEDDTASVKRVVGLILKTVTNHRTKEEIVVSAYPSRPLEKEDSNIRWIDIVVQERENESQTKGYSSANGEAEVVKSESEKDKRLLAKELQQAQEAAKQVGGRVELHAEKGLGIVVTLKLPFRLFKHPHQIKESPETTRNGEISGVTILVAEDDPINRRIVRTLLERRGWRVIEVEDGEQAVNQWRTRQPDLILMDIRMPKIDGYEATKMIREEEKTRGAGTVTPIVALTAYAMQEDREKCVALGMNEYVSKPIQKEELIAKILQLIGRSEA